MTSLRWVDAFSLQMPPLDDAHRQLFGGVRTAIVALRQEHPKEAAQAIAALGEVARRHFQEEELLMREIDYPSYYNHGEQHRCLILDLERLQSTLAFRTPNTTMAIHELRSWFSLHLLKHDRALSTYVSRLHH